MFQIIKRKYLYVGISALLVLISIGVIASFGFRLGIDFTGGTLWQISFSSEDVSRESLNDFFKDSFALENLSITEEGTGNSFLIRGPEVTEELHREYVSALTTEFGAFEELRFESIGASIGAEVRKKALYAFIFVLVSISLYVAFAFRKVSRPVSSWKYGVITLVTLFHDAIIPTALIAFLGTIRNVEIDTNFIVAILVVMGFSVHDTIVVFDRIRENVSAVRNKENAFDTVVNESINQTIARSINTSITLLFVLVALYVYGAAPLQYFVLAILVGTIAGTYSSIFLASPLLTIWRKRS